MKCNHCLSKIEEHLPVCPYCGKDPALPPVGHPGAASEKDVPPIARQADQTTDALSALRQGLAAFRQNNPQAAAQYFLMAIKVDSSMAEAFNALGYLYYTKDKFDKAADFFQKATKLSQNNSTFHYNLASSYFRLHQYSQGLEHARRALELAPDSQKAHQLLIHYQILERDVPDLEDMMQQAEQNLATNHPETAIQLLTTLISYYPQEARAFRFLGQAYAMSNRLEEAIRALEQSVKMQTNSMAFHLLGKLYSRNGQLNYALAAFQRALELEPENSEILYSIGLAYESDQNYAKALRAFQASYQQDAEYFNALYKMALLFKQMDRHDEAIKAYQQLLKLNPNHPTATDELAKLEQLT